MRCAFMHMDLRPPFGGRFKSAGSKRETTHHANSSNELLIDEIELSPCPESDDIPPRQEIARNFGQGNLRSPAVLNSRGNIDVMAPASL